MRPEIRNPANAAETPSEIAAANSPEGDPSLAPARLQFTNAREDARRIPVTRKTRAARPTRPMVAATWTYTLWRCPAGSTAPGGL